MGFCFWRQYAIGWWFRLWGPLAWNSSAVYLNMLLRLERVIRESITGWSTRWTKPDKFGNYYYVTVHPPKRDKRELSQPMVMEEGFWHDSVPKKIASSLGAMGSMVASDSRHDSTNPTCQNDYGKAPSSLKWILERFFCLSELPI